MAICALPMQANDDDGEVPATRKEKLAMWRARRLAAKAAEEEAEERERQVHSTPPDTISALLQGRGNAGACRHCDLLSSCHRHHSRKQLLLEQSVSHPSHVGSGGGARRARPRSRGRARAAARAVQELPPARAAGAGSAGHLGAAAAAGAHPAGACLECKLKYLSAASKPSSCAI